MTSTDHLILILLAAVVTFCPRFFPLRIFTQHHIPQWFNEWMKYVPISLFTALVIKNIFITTKGYHFVPYGHPDQIFAALIVMVIAYFTRSMSISVIAGLVGVWLLNMVL